MKKCYEEISMYIENDLNISGSGVAILTTILGRMGDTENKEAFDTIKNVAETAALRLRMDEIINTKEFNRLSELIDNCIFCEQVNGVSSVGLSRIPYNEIESIGCDLFIDGSRLVGIWITLKNGVEIRLH